MTDNFTEIHRINNSLFILPKLSSHDGGGEYKTKEVTIFTPDKNDGVVNVTNAKWSASDSFDDNNNIYMRDTNITPNGDDGGYNHFELRNAYRAYTHTENGQVVFREGDDNPSMEKAADWIGRLNN